MPADQAGGEAVAETQVEQALRCIYLPLSFVAVPFYAAQQQDQANISTMNETAKVSV